MPCDVVAMITEHREMLLAEIITPYVPGWPEKHTGVTIEQDVGVMRVYVGNELVGRIEEMDGAYPEHPDHFPNLETAVRDTFSCWRKGETH